jgi:hypothetical protein
LGINETLKMNLNSLAAATPSRSVPKGGWSEMGTKGTEFHALELKIRALAETLHEKGAILNPSRPEFARFANINYDRLKAAWANGRLSVDLHEKIVKAGGFERSDPTWFDPNVSPKDRSKSDTADYPGRDTVSNFSAMLRKRHGIAAEIVRVVDDRPRLLDSNLLTFTVEDSGQGTTLGQPASLFFAMVLEPGYHESGLIYGFRRVRLRLNFDEKSRIRLKNRLAHEKDVKIGSAVLVARGDEHNSEWFLEAEATMLQGEFATRSDPLCNLTGFGIEEQFEAEVSVRLLDGTLVGHDGIELGDNNKRRIVEILSAKKLADAPDSQGWLSLGRQKLRIIRGDRT